MPSLAELTRPYKQAEEEATEAKDEPGLDPVGRDLMNALMANFKPKFKDKSDDSENAPKAETPKEE